MERSREESTEEARQESRERIAEAREEAAAYVVQRQPLDPGTEVGEAEERVVEAVEAARSESDAEQLDDLAEEAEAGRDELRSRLYGPGAERSRQDGS